MTYSWQRATLTEKFLFNFAFFFHFGRYVAMTELRRDAVEADEALVKFTASGTLRYIGESGHNLKVRVKQAVYEFDRLTDDDPTIEVEYKYKIDSVSTREFGGDRSTTIELDGPCEDAQDVVEQLQKRHRQLGVEEFEQWVDANTPDALESGTELVTENEDERTATFRTWFTRGDHEGSIKTEFKWNPWDAPDDTIKGKVDQRYLGNKKLAPGTIELDAEDVDTFERFKQKARDAHDERAEQFREKKFSVD